MTLNELPTSLQVAALKAVDTLTKKLGRAPSIREVGRELEMAAPASAKRVMDELVKKGLLTMKQIVIQGKPKVTAAGKKWL